MRRAGGERGTDDNDEGPTVRDEMVREEGVPIVGGLGGAIDKEW